MARTPEVQVLMRRQPATSSTPTPTPAPPARAKPSRAHLAASKPKGPPKATASSEPPSAPTPTLGPFLPTWKAFPPTVVDPAKLAPLGAVVELPALPPEDDKLAEALADALGEHETGTRQLIERVVDHLGAAQTRRIYEKTRNIEASGGWFAGPRRRTTGGIFFVLARKKMGQREFDRVTVLLWLSIGRRPKDDQTEEDATEPQEGGG